MSELCKYDEQVLDYLYGELAPPERAAFAEHLSGCASCRREIDSLSGVRKKTAELPRPVLAADAAAKMTAQLMEAAIAATKQKPAVVPLGGGKLIPFPSGRVRRVLTHPTTAALTVAAAALFLVVFKSKDPMPPVSDSPAVIATAKPPVATAAPGTATTQVPVIETVTESKSSAKAASSDGIAGGVMGGEDGKRQAPSKPDPLKTGFFDGRFADSTSRARSGTAATGMAAEPPKKPVWGPPPAPPPAAKPSPMYELAKDARQAPTQGVAPYDSRFSQPPPAEQAAPPVTLAQVTPAPAAVEVPPQVQAPAGRTTVSARDDDAVPSGIVAQSKARQQQRTMDELERAELAQTVGPGDSGGYARRQVATDNAGSIGSMAAGAGSNAKEVPSEEEPMNNLGKQAAVADKVAEKAADRAGPLSLVYEHIRSGRCGEARDLLHKVERTQPGTPGLVDANAAWQRDCGVRMQLQNVQGQPNLLNVPQQNNQNLPQRMPLPSASAPAPRMEKMPMESQQYGNRDQMDMRRAMTKKASAPAPVQKAPAKAKASKAAAADTAF